MNDKCFAERECTKCHMNFIVRWWSNFSRVSAMKLELCPSCEIQERPNGIIANWTSIFSPAPSDERPIVKGINDE